MTDDRSAQVGGLEGIHPARSTPEEDLDHALADVRAALDAGQSAASMTGSASGGTLPGPHTLARVLVRVRTSPTDQVDPVDDESATRMRHRTVRGPFRNDAGEWVWIDSFAPCDGVRLYARRPFGDPVLLGFLPISHEAGDRLAAGSLWLAAASLVPGRPLDEFVGLRITGGTVQVEGVIGTTGTAVTVDGRWRVRLWADLDLAPPGAASRSGPGTDAARAVVHLPASATFAFSPAGTTVGFADADAVIYGSGVELSRSELPPFYEPMSRSIVVPGDVPDGAFTFADVRSDLWSVGDTAAIGDCGWALPVTRTLSGTVAEADGVGTLALGLRSTVRARWRGLAAPSRLSSTMLHVAPGHVSLYASVDEPGISQRLRLWDEPTTPARRSSVDFIGDAASTLLYQSRAGREEVRLRGAVVGHLDQPLAADGERIPLRMPYGRLVLVHETGATTVTVVADDPGAANAPHHAFALENALLRVRPPKRLELTGTLTEDHVDDGRLQLRCTGDRLLPTLPDPYAANYELPQRTHEPGSAVLATVSWRTPSEPTLSFTARRGLRQTAVQDAGRRGERWEPMLVLLDVSGNADQFGVALPVEAMGTLTVDGLSLNAPGDVAAVMTLPPISWEPMLTKEPYPGSGDLSLLPPPHDGGPAAVRVRDETAGPFAPLPLLTACVDGIATGLHFQARLPLPFGLTAQVDTRRDTDREGRAVFHVSGGTVRLNQPAFDGPLVGGAQLAIHGRGIVAAEGTDPLLPGHVETEDDYAKSVLSTNIHDAFVRQFGNSGTGQGVPLRHYELSGYGASLFSDWRDHAAVGPAIIEARFDVLVGRTTHEVIQMQSVLYPLHVRVVRTITIDRTRGGWVLREDSGWVAAGDGRLDYLGDAAGLPAPVPPAFPEEARHPGPFEAAEHIRNIRLAAPHFTLPARAGEPDQTATTWQPVTFDCDILFAEEDAPRLRAAEGSRNRRAAASGCTGWILIDGPMYETTVCGGDPVKRVRPADARQVFDLLATQGPGMHPVDCLLHLGVTDADAPGLVLRTTRVDVSCDQDSAAPHLVVAARGSPVLPRDGAWSVVRRATGESAPKALDPSFPVPVVRPNGTCPGSDRWHLADPADITALADTASPAVHYGFVQSLATQKVFFERPRVGNDPRPVTLPRPPRLADMGALLSAVGAFPGLADAFDFTSLRDLAVAGDGLEFDESFALNATKETLLMDLGGPDALQVLLDYHDKKGNPTQATVTVAPGSTPRWCLSLSQVRFLVRYRGQPLVSVFGRVKADERTAPTVDDLWVSYGGFLQNLQSLFTNVQQVAAFLPGGKSAGLKVGFSPGRLTVRNSFSLPNLPLGAGQITDVAVNTGFDISLSPRDVRFVAGLGSQAQPFRWIVSPLAGTGVVQVAIDPEGLDIVVQGGLGLGLAIDLGIASGAASVALAVELNTDPTPFELRGILSGRASVDVLQGLAGATLTLAAGLGVIPEERFFAPPFVPPDIPPPNPLPELTVGLTASVSVGIHLSVCWVADVDWDGYWQFRQDITTPPIPIPL